MYEAPAVAVKVALSPTQSRESLLVIEIVALKLLIVTATVVELEQAPLNAVSVNVVAAESGGVTNGFVVAPPGFHEYVVPPEAVSVAVLPGQTATGFATTLGVGAGVTLTTAVSLPEQFEASDAVTIYVVVEAGVTVITGPAFAGIQAKLVAVEELAVSVVLCPLQMVVTPVIVTVGEEFTLTETVPVDAQPPVPETVTV